MTHKLIVFLWRSIAIGLGAISTLHSATLQENAMKSTRRQFLGATAAALLSSSSQAAGPNEAIRIGLVGAGWRGGQLIPQFAKIPDVRIVAVCDPDSARAAEKAKQVADLTGVDSAKVEIDLRRVKLVPTTFVERDYRHVESDLVLLAPLRRRKGERTRQVLLVRRLRRPHRRWTRCSSTCP